MRPAAPFLMACALLAGAGLAPPDARAAYAVRGFVLGNGATPGEGAASAGRRLFGTAGQPVVGASAGAARELCHGFWCVGGAQVVSVEDPAPSGPGAPRIPNALAFGAPRPNPARDAARFAVDLPRAARVELAILDVQGRRVRTVDPGALDAGFHTLGWDGRDEGGRAAGSGVYFARLAVDGVPVGVRRFVLRR